MTDNLTWIEVETDLFSLKTIRKENKKLENWIYTVVEDSFGNKYLKKIHDQFEFPYKVYGLEESFVSRCLKTFEATKGNLGILLNGLKGTGKTVTSKILCNKLQLPVILIEKNMDNIFNYINDIPQDVVIFIDEYEKIFEENSGILTITDGALNSDYRRFFILTTNKTYINENMLQRPSRIRYLKTFKDLGPKIIQEILDDTLIHKELNDATIQFISSLEIITVDIVKAIVQEVNIHQEDPKLFADVFNVKQITGKYDVVLLDPSSKKEYTLKKSAQISPRVDYDPDREVGRTFYIDNTYVGDIIEVLDRDMVKVLCPVQKGNDLYRILEKSAKDLHAEDKNAPMPGVFVDIFLQLQEKAAAPEVTAGLLATPAVGGDDMEDTPKTKAKKSRKKGQEAINVELVFRVTNSFMTHRAYTWGNYEYYS